METVLLYFPVAVNLAIAEPSEGKNPFGIANQHSETHAFSAGLNPVPADLANHPYLKRCGVTRYTGPVIAADPAVVRRHAEDLQIAEKARADIIARSLAERLQGNADRVATQRQKEAEAFDAWQLSAGLFG